MGYVMELLDRICIPDARLVEADYPGTEESAWVGEATQRLITIGAEPTGELAELVRKLESCGQLAPNWDSYGGHPPSLRALERSFQLIQEVAHQRLPLPVVLVPTSGGGLQFEWRGRGQLEVEIDRDGAASTLMSRDDDEWENSNVTLAEVVDMIAATEAHAISGPA
ncbi:MAG: hypothetical protein AB1758_04100 [Candidatus Eremiobacterota bacterium]